MKKLTLTFVGWDNWDRPVYECDKRLYVDVDPRKNRMPEICTKNGNSFNGEPDAPLPQDTELEFGPSRITW